METHEQRLAALEASLRDKYSTKDRENMGKSGEALSDGSYPIADGEDLDNAIHAVGRGNASHDAIRRHIVDRAKVLGMTNKIPDNWNTDGSLKQDNDAELDTEQRELAPTPAAGEEQARPRRQRHRALPLMQEVRFWKPSTVEMRDGDNPNEIVITGTPIVYDTPYRVVDEYGEFEERMLPGAASALIAGRADTRFLFNHDGLPMARSVNDRGLAPTLTLTESSQGLHFSARVDTGQSAARDLVIAIERGDVSQMSVGMIVKRDTWDAGLEHRDIHEIGELLDVSAVTYPASPSTSIEVARRMALAIPIASHARARKFYADARAGMKMSNENQSKVLGALHMMHSALTDAGAQLPWEDDDADDVNGETPDASTSTADASEGGDGLNDDESSEGVGAGLADGSGLGTARSLRLQLELRKRRLRAA